MSFERMTRARSALILDQPFFGTLALHLELVEDEDIGTMATDGRRLIWAPSFVDKTPDPELRGVIVHEILHCAFQHHTRREGREMGDWNVACDYCINPEVLAAGFKLPKDALLDAAYRGMGAEEIYSRLKKKRAKQPKAGSALGAGKDAGAAEGSGSSPSPSGAGNAAGEGAGGATVKEVSWGKVLDAGSPFNPAETAAIRADWDRYVKQAISVAKAQNAGTIPASLMSIVEANQKVTVNWRDELRRFIDDKTRVDYSWSKPNRRFLQTGFILPGVFPDGIGKLGIVVDTSGSISDYHLSAFYSEIESAIDAGAVAEVVVVQCDAKVQRVDRFQSGDTIKTKAYGRGGTRFSPALQWFRENEPDVAALIYFTDLYVYDWGTEPDCPVLWAACGQESELNHLVNNVPFGEVIRLENER